MAEQLNNREWTIDKASLIAVYCSIVLLFKKNFCGSFGFIALVFNFDFSLGRNMAEQLNTRQ